jgi:hypothetical protein
MDQDWPADELIVADEPSCPQRRGFRAAGKVVAPDPRLQGHDAAKEDAASTDWDTVQALTFTANGLAG